MCNLSGSFVGDCDAMSAIAPHRSNSRGEPGTSQTVTVTTNGPRLGPYPASSMPISKPIVARPQLRLGGRALLPDHFVAAFRTGKSAHPPAFSSLRGCSVFRRSGPHIRRHDEALIGQCFSGLLKIWGLGEQSN